MLVHPSRGLEPKCLFIRPEVWRLNACSSVQRSGAQIRKKWNDYKSQVKKKAIDVRRQSCKTGGGPAPVGLSDLEDKVVSMIPQCQIEGINGGLESEVDEICATLENQDSTVCPFVEVDEAFESGLTVNSLPVITTPVHQPLIATSALLPSQPSSKQAAEQPEIERHKETVNATEIHCRSILTHKSRKSEREAQPSVTDILESEKEKTEVLKVLLEVQRKILDISEQ
ncbi:uncharacterized protein [Haliotis asinina]|uniref:uncharacterized protein isoform X2 n=1 Tax=Haliotis asinina TaxID=109174 RepID=UPI0035319DC1